MMNDGIDTPDALPPQVGICVLNYHHPVETAQCIESLLRKEPPTTRILWIENDAGSTRADMMAVLDHASFPWAFVTPDSQALPPSGTVGVLCNEQNLGYAGGNNPGLRLLHKLGVPYAWVLNNDTELLEGCSNDLVEAATARPEVGAWGTLIHAHYKLPTAIAELTYLGGSVSQKDFRIILAQSVQTLETDPFAYVSGCSLFCRASVFAEVGFIPEDYFLYYEDPAFTYELRKRGYQISGVPSVKIHHLESLATGRRSSLMEYYNRRNRWFFIERYHPEALEGQKMKLWYTLQKFLFRLKFSRIREEWISYRDYKKGRLGPTTRKFSRRARV